MVTVVTRVASKEKSLISDQTRKKSIKCRTISNFIALHLYVYAPDCKKIAQNKTIKAYATYL